MQPHASDAASHEEGESGEGGVGRREEGGTGVVYNIKEKPEMCLTARDRQSLVNYLFISTHLSYIMLFNKVIF